MQPLTKLTICLLVLFMLGCQKDDMMDAGGPISRYVSGKWKLDKIVTPTQTKIGSQIGYNELIESTSDQEKGFDRVFRDSVLIATHIMSRNPWPVASAKDMTVLITYTDGLKRFFKIRQDLTTITLQTSGYLPELGTAQDSVKYYYSRAE